MLLLLFPLLFFHTITSLLFTGLSWSVLVWSGLVWSVLVCSGLFWSVLNCPELCMDGLYRLLIRNLVLCIRAHCGDHIFIPVVDESKIFQLYHCPAHPPRWISALQKQPFPVFFCTLFFKLDPDITADISHPHLGKRWRKRQGCVLWWIWMKNIRYA